MSVAQRDVWDLKIAKDTILKTWNAANPLDIPDRLMQRRLVKLGHVVRMPEERMPRMFAATHCCHHAQRVARGNDGETQLGSTCDE